MENISEIRKSLNDIVKPLRKINDQLNSQERALLIRLPKEIRDTYLKKDRIPRISEAMEAVETLRGILNKYTMNNQVEQEDHEANMIIQDQPLDEADVLGSTPIRFIGDRIEDLYNYIVQNNNVIPVSYSSRSRKRIKNIHDLHQTLSIEPITIITQIPGDDMYPYQATVQSFRLANGALIETASAQVRKTQQQLENLTNKDLISMGRYVSKRGKNIAKPITRASELRMIKNLDVEKLRDHL